MSQSLDSTTTLDSQETVQQVIEIAKQCGIKALFLPALMKPPRKSNLFRLEVEQCMGNRLVNEKEASHLFYELEQRGLLATRQVNYVGQNTGHLCVFRAEKRTLESVYHVTLRGKLAQILRDGLVLSTQETSNSPPRERLDQIGSIYACEELSISPTSEFRFRAAEHWLKLFSAKRQDVAASEWVIIRVDLVGLPNLRLYNDPWSDGGLLLRTEIPPPRIVTDLNRVS